MQVDVVCNAIAHSTGALLLEGLPHQGFERALLEAELRLRPVRAIGGFPFYVETLTLSPDDATCLRSSFSMKENLPPFTEGKLCGGFHPDFAIEWLGCKIPMHSLLCFGCAEVMFVESGSTLQTDWAQGEWLRVYEVVRSYPRNRPGDYLESFMSQIRRELNGA